MKNSRKLKKITAEASRFFTKSQTFVFSKVFRSNTNCTSIKCSNWFCRIAGLISQLCKFFENFQKLLAILLVQNLCCPASAGSRYIGIPLEVLDGIELNFESTSQNRQRVARQTQPLFPFSISNLNNLAETEEIDQDDKRVAQILDYVDFGAQTGPNGSFSWFADYPAQPWTSSCKFFYVK